MLKQQVVVVALELVAQPVRPTGTSLQPLRAVFAKAKQGYHRLVRQRPGMLAGRSTGTGDQPGWETMYQLRQGTRDLVVRLVPESVRRSLRPKRRREPVVGRPPGLDSELLEGIFEEATGAKMGAVSHIQISGWRKPSSGTFRVFVDATDGGNWSVIFKNAVLTSDETPGISGLPANPGLPEYLIYRRGSEYLRAHLPLPFVVTEIEPKVHYQYLLEDLQSGGYHSAFPDADVIRAAAALPSLQKHMETWVPHDDDSLIRYDAAFSADLRRMTRRSFERYAEAVPDRSVADVLENWESIAASSFGSYTARTNARGADPWRRESGQPPGA